MQGLAAISGAHLAAAGQNRAFASSAWVSMKQTLGHGLLLATIVRIHCLTDYSGGSEADTEAALRVELIHWEIGARAARPG
jgi:hypothetical protein